jgi:hypothetical protein
MAKSRPHRRKNPKIDLWEITGCAQIQEIERPALTCDATGTKVSLKHVKLQPLGFHPVNTVGLAQSSS